MPRLPTPFKDVFEHGPASGAGASTAASANDFEGAQLKLGNGTFLGNVTRNKFDPNSLSNQFGVFGSRYSQTSIFNEYSQFGGKYGQHSPFNPYASDVPAVTKNGRSLGFLSINKALSPRIDPSALLAWLDAP